MNLTKILVDEYGYSFERLALRIGCSFNSIKNWYFERTKPIHSHRKKLEQILKEKEKQDE